MIRRCDIDDRRGSVELETQFGVVLAWPAFAVGVLLQRETPVLTLVDRVILGKAGVDHIRIIQHDYAGVIRRDFRSVGLG